MGEEPSVRIVRIPNLIPYCRTSTLVLESIVQFLFTSFRSRKCTRIGLGRPITRTTTRFKRTIGLVCSTASVLTCVFRYFDHAAKVLDLEKDSAFETVVTSAEFDTDTGRWTVQTQDGRTATAKYLIVAAGFSAKRCEYFPIILPFVLPKPTLPRHQTSPTSPASTLSKAKSTTPPSGRRPASTGPTSASPSLAPAPQACR